MSVKVGVDARFLSEPLSGLGRYTLEMCLELNKIDDVYLYLYSPKPISNELRVKFVRAIIKTRNINSKSLRQLWGETCLPWWVSQDNIDVFWGPAHRLPRLLPRHIARVVTIHDLVWKFAAETMPRISFQLERFQMPFAVRASDKVVAISQATARSVREEFHIAKNKMQIVSLGANSINGGGVIEDLYRAGVVKPYFLFVGTLEPRKNLIRLLTAYSQLDLSSKEKAMLVIAGGKGWGKVSIEDVVVKLDLQNYVRILGYVDESLLVTLYSNAMFLAMPSLYEGFGLPLLEAMSHGVPVLTANNSSMPEVAGNAGVFVEAKDIGSIMNGLDKLITDTEYRRALSFNAPKKAEAYSWAESAKELFVIFEDAIISRKKNRWRL